jgi:glutathione S-transferase
MKLLGSNRSPYFRKVRVAIAEKGVPCDIVELAASAPEVAAANPLAKIPTLIRDDGRPLYDSAVIVEYLDGLAPAPKLIPDAFEARIEVRRWEALASGVMDATVTIHHENRLPEPERRGADFFSKHQNKIDAGLAAMDRDIGERAFCFGDSFTLADIACGSALSYLDTNLPATDWRKRHPALGRLAARLAERSSFKAIMA